MDEFPNGLGQAVIYSLPDSTLRKGGYLDSNVFNITFNTKNNVEFYLRLKVPGFSDTLIAFSATDSVIKLGDIELSSNRALDVIDVVYVKPMFERSMDGISVNVQGTSLQNLTNLFEVLKASPKLTSPDDERIEIIGKGVPLILVDRQAIISNEELKAIPASQIEKIEIISNPSAKYKAQGSGSGVIEVYTKNFHLEGYSMTVSADGGVSTQLMPTGRLTSGLSLKKKKFSLNGYLGANYNSGVTIGTTTGATTDDSNREQFSEYRNENGGTWQYYNLKGAYTISAKQRLTAGVNGYGSRSNTNNESSSEYFTNDVLMTKQVMLADPSTRWANNSAFINYTLETDTFHSAFEVNINYINKVSSGQGIYAGDFQDFTTNTSSIFKVRNDHKDRPNIGEVRINYDHNFDTTKWKLSVGGSYNMLFNGKVFNQFNPTGEAWIVDSVYSNSYDYQEQIGAVFAEVSKKWNKFGFRLGVRGEYTYLNGFSNSLDKEFIDSSYILPFPNASIMFEPNDKVGLTFSYSSGIERPQFSNFDPFVRIQDSLNISYGNPFLRPAIEQTLGMNVDLFYAYSFSVNYSYVDKPTSELSFVSDSTFLIETTPYNADYKQKLSFSLNLPIQLKWLTGWNSLWFDYNKYNFTTAFERDPFLNTSYGIYSNLNFVLPKDFSLLNRTYFYKYGNASMSSNAVVNWGMRLTKKYKGNNFQIYADVSNIIPQKNIYSQVSGNYNGKTITQNNFTSFKLGLFYKFGRLKRDTQIKESSSGQSDRL